MKNEKKISCIIVDDEPHAIEGLKRYMTAIPALEVVKTYTDPVRAMLDISSGNNVDLILLDVDMPGITGIELGESVKPKTNKLVFTTAHSKYAYEAFEVEADDFLLKPYSLAKFIKTINKLFPQKIIETESEDSGDYMFIKSKEDNLRLVKIRYKDIVAVESRLNYVQIHTLSKSITTYMSLSEVSKKLNQFDWFMQFQRSFIIAPEYIEYIEGSAIKMQNGTRITVGEYYKKYFNDFVDSKLIKARRK
ncbi:LytR/AlgR family response regulator transcription factor [Pedobacter rhodius]|uniref:LytTR family DNA-binding domain-containing protein n=1 Tax=Pedobacter rhodius TaxID=3004098 RepID=A0ABT4L0Y0_9SPHI|nr:LytTR family DNA-binding domain-containing protein [Pedobacter sp. SJ11]MCZ4224846.1 LytTR family DNA-binding domain-containing protein [Pedobacter sp. SJ11]